VELSDSLHRKYSCVIIRAKTSTDGNLKGKAKATTVIQLPHTEGTAGHDAEERTTNGCVSSKKRGFQMRNETKIHRGKGEKKGKESPIFNSFDPERGNQRGG